MIWVTTFMPILMKFLDKEEHILFISGIFLGFLLGAMSAYIYLNITNRKDSNAVVVDSPSK